MNVKCGQILAPAVTGNNTHALTGFTGTPKAIIFWTTNQTSNASAGGATISIGMAVAADKQVALNLRAFNGAATITTGRRQTNINCISITQHSNNASMQLNAAFVSFGSAEVTLNWKTTNENTIVNYMAIGGSDINVSFLEQTAATATSTQNYNHGLETAPSAIFALGGALSSLQGDSAPLGIAGLTSFFGFWADGVQKCLSASSQNSVGVTNNRTVVSNNLISNISSSTDTVLRSAAVSAVDATNITLDWTINTSSATYFWMLAVSGIAARCGSIVAPVAGSPPVIQNVTLSSITPETALLMTPMRAASGSFESNCIVGFGGSDGVNHGFTGITDENGADTSNTRKNQSLHAIDIVNLSGTTLASSDASFAANELSFSWDTIDAVAHEVIYLVLGAPGPIFLAGTINLRAIGAELIYLQSDAADGGEEPYSYQWQRSLNGSDWLNLTGATGLTLEDTDIVEGTTYYYRMQVIDDSAATVHSNVIQVKAQVAGGFSGPPIGKHPLIG